MLVCAEEKEEEEKVEFLHFRILNKFFNSILRMIEKNIV
jgi:hypothetical protein